LALRWLRLRLGDTRRRRPAIALPPDPEQIRMTRAPFVTPRSRYDDSDFAERMEAAMARTRRLIDCSRAIRASVESHDETPFTPRCANCRQAGRMHDSPPTAEHHYICAHGHKRWVVDGVLP
jgi:lysyl-tRNA synthetase class I